jgi:O-antigen/teichoic acid export membrane protein
MAMAAGALFDALEHTQLTFLARVAGAVTSLMIGLHLTAASGVLGALVGRCASDAARGSILLISLRRLRDCDCLPLETA